MADSSKSAVFDREGHLTLTMESMILHTKNQIADDICLRGFHIIDNFLIPDHYHALQKSLSLLYESGSFQPAKIGNKSGKSTNTQIRNDEICWLDKSEDDVAIRGYFTEMDKLSGLLNQSLFLGLTNYEAHFAIYQPNNFYRKHIDQFATTKDRRISCVYYLNDDWQQAFGGELKLYDKEDQLLTQVLPIGNRFICFNSDLPHEVCTAYQTRYSIAAWLKVRSIELVD